MEATKLHTVIADAIDESSTFDLSTDIKILSDAIKNGAPEQITASVKKIEDSLTTSRFNRYSYSNYKILQEIGGSKYFGKEALQHITLILSQSSFNIAKTVSELETYQLQRIEFINSVASLSEIFEKLNIGMHYYEDDIYEIGILFPKSEKENTVVNITKELNKWDMVIKTFRELVGVEVKDTEITLVNNGSVDFFTTETAQVAFCISYGLERLFVLYKRISEIRKTRERLKELGVPKIEEDATKKHEKEIYGKEIDSITTELVKQFASKKIESGRLNELKVLVNRRLVYFARIIDDGLIIEITPPEISEPEILAEAETDENKKERSQAEKDYKEKIAKREAIDRTVDLAKEIATTGKDVFKLLASGEDDEDAEKPEKKK
jgi:hypothetical protein